jgi:hypothetical protein
MQKEKPERRFMSDGTMHSSYPVSSGIPASGGNCTNNKI